MTALSIYETTIGVSIETKYISIFYNILAICVRSHHLKSFCERLLAQVPSLHLWATRVYFGNIPQGWLTGPLNVPLRFPPVVMREVAKAKNRQLIQKFDPGKVRSFTDGPSVEIMCHQGQDHSYRFEDCVPCGWNLGLYLRKLGVTGTSTYTE